MQIEDKKREIVLKTAELILSADGKEITTRKIAEHADINPAMVNYYFGSKDNLLKAALSSMNKDGVFDPSVGHEGSRKTMFDLLLGKCETTLQYSKVGIGRDAVSFTGDALETSSKIIEMKKQYDGKASNKEDINSVFRIVCFLMAASTDPEGFAAYSGIDIRIKSQLKVLISEQLDILLGEAL